MSPAAAIALVTAPMLAWAILPPLLARPRDAFEGFEQWTRVPAAHRGLTGPHAPENSLEAFDAAARAGLAIELDVRACRDGLVVIHDGALRRLCGRDARVRDLTVAQVQELRLMGTDAHVPTLAQALCVIAGRVPVVIELKDFGIASARRMVRKLAQALDGYRGAYCAESFNPMALMMCRRYMPDAARGQLIASPKRMRRMCGCVAGWAFANLLLTPLARPQFVAYEWNAPMSRGLRTWRRCGGKCAAWDVAGRADANKALAQGEMAIYSSAPHNAADPS